MSRATVRPAERRDVPVIVALIRELAIFEKEEHQVKITEEQLERDGFDEPRRFHALIGELDGAAVAYALYFFSYSTWVGTCMYLEDLYVQEASRGKGVGMALLKGVAAEAHRNACGRLQFQVLDWNKPAIDFYVERMGARERLESGNGKWMNMIMNGEEIASFLAQ